MLENIRGGSKVISRVTIVITYIRGLITPLATTHEPPSKLCFPSLRPQRIGARHACAALLLRCVEGFRRVGVQKRSVRGMVVGLFDKVPHGFGRFLLGLQVQGLGVKTF